MSKKRLRHAPLRQSPRAPTASKHQPGYWRGRLFKPRYTYKGRPRHARNWSVKIQHLGRRKTFSLQSVDLRQAAAEACALYRTLLRHGWTVGTAARGRSGSVSNVSRKAAFPPAERLESGYWEQRLIHREYTMKPWTGANPELSIRIDHSGTGHYFPLGTADRREAARRALRIYRAILRQGWERANQRFSRELTVAFRWLDSPLAWTYTTLHTLTAASASNGVPIAGAAEAIFDIAIAESDADIRRALEWCMSHMPGYQCVAAFASGAEVLSAIARRPVHLVLISHSLSDKPGANSLAELRAAAPNVPGLLYSVYEDSEELFRATPGGAGMYLLRRTAPTEFLQPIAGRLKEGPLPAADMASAAWQYFKESVAAMPIGGAARHLASLTHREHEVLGLLSKGHPDKDIAYALGISIHTVHEHVRNIFEKLGARNRTEAAVKFFQK